MNKYTILLNLIFLSSLSLADCPSHPPARGEKISQSSGGEPCLTCHSIAKLQRRHNEALYGKIAYYIQNHLPIRLLQLSNMTLVDRPALQEWISAKINKGSFYCRERKCVCVERVKNEFKYSILSHRWGFPEVTFSDFGKFHEQLIQSGRLPYDATVARMYQLWGNPRFRPSTDKLVQFREVSLQRQCNYGWIDTVCINKESSAELDESIRSMYAWYKDARVCIVHLSRTDHFYSMKNDPWFTRGWTLQELLAPRQIKFFSSDWKEITLRENDKDLDNAEQQAAKDGKDDPPLWSTISKITGIPIEDLLDFKPGLYDIGKRMNWASRRTTTRVEDMAYCLIGIFRVNLSVSYGEKEGAFYRLQAEIMQNSDDQSLFNWEGKASAYNSMFAASPQCFSQALDLIPKNLPPIDTDPYSISGANFERRVSCILYYKSECPDYDIWEDPKATAFMVIGPLSKPGGYGLMLLEQVGGDQHYKRLKRVEIVLGGQLPERNPSEILIK